MHPVAQMSDADIFRVMQHIIKSIYGERLAAVFDSLRCQFAQNSLCIFSVRILVEDKPDDFCFVLVYDDFSLYGTVSEQQGAAAV